RGGERFFQLGDAFLLTIDPLRLQFAAGGLSLARAFAGGGRDPLPFVRAAGGVGVQVAGVARVRGGAGVCVVEGARGQAQAARDFDTAGSAGDADEQTIGGAEIGLVEFHGGVDDAGRGGSVGFQAIVVRGGERERTAVTKFLEQRDGESGAFFGRGAG